MLKISNRLENTRLSYPQWGTCSENTVVYNVYQVGKSGKSVDK